MSNATSYGREDHATEVEGRGEIEGLHVIALMNRDYAKSKFVNRK